MESIYNNQTYWSNKYQWHLKSNMPAKKGYFDGPSVYVLKMTDIYLIRSCMYVGMCCENACFDWYLCRLWSLSRANEMNSPRISCFDLRSSCSTSCREVTNLHLAILATNSGGRCINHLDCNHIKYSLMVHYYECIYDINWYKIGHYLFWDDMILICFHLIKNGYIWVSIYD